MKANTAFVLNKKLIIHFDIDYVIRLPEQDKDLYVYEMCSAWVWGKLEKNSKQDADKVTGWKLAVNSLSIEQPDADLVTYKAYLEEYVKPEKEQYQKLMLNLSKGPAAKAKAEIEKNIKNITIPKTLLQALKQTNNPDNKLHNQYTKTGKYQILPSFFKMLLSLKKSKREFACIIKNNKHKDNHEDIINELNLFFTGQHPLYNGKNGTPLVKWDGSKGTKNFIIEDSHYSVFYTFPEKQLASTYGTLQITEEKDPEMFKQKYKSLKTVKLCDNLEEIYAVSHAILAEAGCIYEINALHSLVIDPVDYQTHEIYFTVEENPSIYSCLGDKITDNKNFFVKINMFDYLKDVDFFAKNIEVLEKNRAAEIERIEKGQSPVQQQQQVEQNSKVNEERQTDSEYLKRTLLPVLEGAMKQVDLFRPKDPLGYIALYCLKNRDKLE